MDHQDNDITIKMQDKLFDMFKIFHKICAKNNIKYYMLGGTMLGAIRHQDFIPWDDDMDIGMLREDYDRLANLPANEWPDNITLNFPIKQPNYTYSFAKLIDNSTTLIEDIGEGVIQGIYIDIFPLDGAGNSWEFVKFHNRIIGALISILHISNLYNYDKKTMLKRIVIKLIKLLKTSVWLKLIDLTLRYKTVRSSRYIGNFLGAWGIKEIMDKNCYGEPTLYRFRDCKFYGPEKYHEYLSSLYGNYMQLPPMEKRKSHHKFKYVNIDLPYQSYKNNLNDGVNN